MTASDLAQDWLESFEPSELRKWQSQLQKSRSAIHLLCTQETRDHADSFVSSCWRAKDSAKESEEKTITALKALTASLHKEIGT